MQVELDVQLVGCDTDVGSWSEERLQKFENQIYILGLHNFEVGEMINHSYEKFDYEAKAFSQKVRTISTFC